MSNKSYLAALAMLAVLCGCRTTAVAETSCPATPAAFQELRNLVTHPRPEHIVVVAHRGCFAAASENTPEAVDACWQMGVEVVENDVRRTRDGHLIVFHDPEISRMTDRWGYVADMTLSELRSARLREKDGAHNGYREAFFTNQSITTLEEYFVSIRHKVMVNFEIKYGSEEEFVSIFNQSVALAREVGVVDHLIFKIPDVRHHGTETSKHILESLDLALDIQLMPMIWESETPISERLAFFDQHNVVGFEVPFQQVTYIEPVRSIASLNDKPVMAISVQPYWSAGLDDRLAMRDPEAAWGRLIELGADHIMTDRPEALSRFLEKTDRRSKRRCE